MPLSCFDSLEMHPLTLRRIIRLTSADDKLNNLCVYYLTAFVCTLQLSARYFHGPLYYSRKLEPRVVSASI
jgi:hypothetical protein